MTAINRRPVIALTGASGYIGRNLLKQLTPYADIIALSRNGGDKEDSEHVTWRSCDLFSMADAEKALEGADYAYYLVHSMKPSAKLTQGTFENMDVILADNFAQAAEKQGIKQIVYLSGLVPDADHHSRHIRSRLEVEQVLSSYQVPVTTLRAGLIVGPNGSSFPILAKMVKRLPVMLLPKWTRKKTHPIYIGDMLDSLVRCAGRTDLYDRSIDVGGPEVMTYKNMMKETAEVMGKQPKMISVPFMTVNLSRLWVSLVSNSPREMVYPLIESLIHPMMVKPENMVSGISGGSTSFREAARKSLEEEKQKRLGRLKVLSIPDIDNDVRSVQRIPLPAGKTALWTAHYYAEWLSQIIHPLLSVQDHFDGVIKIRFRGWTLLELRHSAERSQPDRALFYITGGLFDDKAENERGRLEFRKIPGRPECIIAIHDYMPSLPWFLYKYTQAKAHRFVMYRFRRHLEKEEIEHGTVRLPLLVQGRSSIEQ
ncbi:NAD(P)H-binding protein [Salibacterium halotolerans]|uniref:Uncharacterized conserved protein YbjT, contains NAD(P)-binding and DUF2867 domains n=1 Tax=Salibacterium halotolerans TaxID=1884432 RepID=A0A1I5QU70_9BACI|nr:NAD(P)H-binding protein [Salibacterium halotolerans]SFP49386.1 Uncharacterized conserved protein YbjT, contains NAD(P)-binding and DUF2867 domains [Salibacterium halotolerans]